MFKMFFLSVLGLKPQASCTLEECYATGPHSQLFIYLLHCSGYSLTRDPPPVTSSSWGHGCAPPCPAKFLFSVTRRRWQTASVAHTSFCWTALCQRRGWQCQLGLNPAVPSVMEPSPAHWLRYLVWLLTKTGLR